MKPLLKRLQIEPGASLAVLRAPRDLADVVAGLGSDVTVKTRQSTKHDAVLAFVTSCREIGAVAPKIAAKLEGDALLWMAYPKKSSKRYDSDIGRDDSWSPLGEQGFEAVRQVAIDQDWSALRFRRVEHIRSMKRDEKRAMTARGKARVKRR
jgi:hypothetical protein